MKCHFCDSEMILDDCDYNFKGNKDNYWICEKCNSFTFEKIRYGKSIYKEFHKSENGE